MESAIVQPAVKETTEQIVMNADRFVTAEDGVPPLDTLGVDQGNAWYRKFLDSISPVAALPVRKL